MSSGRSVRWGSLIALLTLVAAMAAAPAAGQEDDSGTGSSGAPSEVVILVLDLSGSMLEGSPPKLDLAKDALRRYVEQLPDGARVGLRVYGDQSASASPPDRQANCETDTRLLRPVDALDRNAFLADIDGLEARGDTPIGLSLQRAVEDIPEGTLGTVVLVSDGKDECHDADGDGDPAVGPSWGPAPCEVAASLAQGGVRLERIDTIGFQPDEAAESQLLCVAEAGGGRYTRAEEPEDVADALIETTAGRRPDRLGGQAITGGTGVADAPLIGLSPDGELTVFTDRISVGVPKWYRSQYEGESGQIFMTSTVFDLPNRPGTSLVLRPVLPDGTTDWIDEPLTRVDAGTSGSGADSVRCACYGAEPTDIYWVLGLESEDPFPGEFDVELALEGEGFGGEPVGCVEGQECFFEGQRLVAEQSLRELTEAEAAAEAQPEAEETEAAAAIPPTKTDTAMWPVVVAALFALAALGFFLLMRRQPRPAVSGAAPPGGGDGRAEPVASATTSSAVVATIDVSEQAVAPAAETIAPAPLPADPSEAGPAAAANALADAPTSPSATEAPPPAGWAGGAEAPRPAETTIVAAPPPPADATTAPDPPAPPTPAAPPPPAAPATLPDPPPSAEATVLPDPPPQPAAPPTTPTPAEATILPDPSPQPAAAPPPTSAAAEATILPNPPPPPTGPPPGWYEDPWGQAAFRWWDGHQWSGTVHPGGGR